MTEHILTLAVVKAKRLYPKANKNIISDEKIFICDITYKLHFLQIFLRHLYLCSDMGTIVYGISAKSKGNGSRFSWFLTGIGQLLSGTGKPMNVRYHRTCSYLYTNCKCAHNLTSLFGGSFPKHPEILEDIEKN